jgi:adenosylcobinamide-GDP ribazoletransferase
MSTLADFATAVRLLTIVPLGTVDGTRPAPYFTWVGWLFAALGAAIASAAFALDLTSGTGALLSGVIVVAAWGALSGFLHWDGLADCADALGVRGDAGRRLAVMRESGVGAFGAVAVMLVALLQASALAAVLESGDWWAIGAAPVVGRLGAALALMFRAPARPDGLAARYASRAGFGGLVAMAVPVLVLLAISPDATRAGILAGGVFVAALAPGAVTRRIGGVTGDVLGATVLATETFVLVLAAMTGGA